MIVWMGRGKSSNQIAVPTHNAKTNRSRNTCYGQHNKESNYHERT